VPKKKILILYTNVGQGHKKIAFNIASVLQTEDNEVVLKNILEVQRGFLSEQGTKVYLSILRNIPWLWSFFYLNKTFISATRPFRRFVAKFNSGKIKKILAEDNYDVVICTQVTASSILSYLKKTNYYKNKFVITFSDYHLHSFWVFDNADLFCANIEEQKREMVGMGYDPKKIIVSGMTLKPKEEINRDETRKKFGLQENEKVILVFGGSLGYGFGIDTINSVLKVCDKVLVVCGNNNVLHQTLISNYATNDKIKIFGFVDNIQEIYSIVDLAVSKPGGLSTAECLQWGIPMVCNSCMPGQEELNFKFLLNKNLIIDGTKNIEKVITEELSTGEFAKSLKSNPEVQKIVGEGTRIREAIKFL